MLPKNGLTDAFEATWGSKMRAGNDEGTQKEPIIRFLKTDHLFLECFGGPHDVKILAKSASHEGKNEKVTKVDFVHPSHAKSLFLASCEGCNGAPKKPVSGF